MVSPEQIIASPSKKPRTENVLKVTSEGLKVVSPEKKASKSPSVQQTSQLHKMDSKLSSNITLLRSPGSNASSSGQGRVFVINPQANASNSKAVVQTIHPTTSSNTTTTNVSVSVASATERDAQKPEISLITSTVKPETPRSTEDTTAESELGNVKAENVEETVDGAKRDEGAENMEVELSGEEKVKIQVVSVNELDTGGGGDDGAGVTEVIEQQDILPGEILQVRDTDGRIIHVTAGENGELIQVCIALRTLIYHTQNIKNKKSEGLNG